jgi:hypothetical protein
MLEELFSEEHAVELYKSVPRNAACHIPPFPPCSVPMLTPRPSLRLAGATSMTLATRTTPGWRRWAAPCPLPALLLGARRATVDLNSTILYAPLDGLQLPRRQRQRLQQVQPAGR